VQGRRELSDAVTEGEIIGKILRRPDYANAIDGRRISVSMYLSLSFARARARERERERERESKMRARSHLISRTTVILSYCFPGVAIMVVFSVFPYRLSQTRARYNSKPTEKQKSVSVRW